MKLINPLSALVIAACLSGCNTIPKDALSLGPESIQERQLQTRKYEGLKENDALAAGAGVLQDLGFTIVESESTLGVVVGNKDRSAVSAGQIAGAVLLAMFTGTVMSTDKDQRFFASLVTRPVIGSDGTPVPDNFYVRVTFARIVKNTQGIVTKAEQVKDEELYRGFFEKMSKAVFLEGQKI